MIIEIIVTNFVEALRAVEYGASRLELIHDFIDGGLSPQFELAKQISKAVDIPVNVMVRPHARSFVYSIKDMQIIHQEIDRLLTYTNTNGIVFGSLMEDHTVNLKQLEAVLRQLEGTGCELTFHRAIDAAFDPLDSFKILQNYGNLIARVLTSGGAATALDGLPILLKMQESRTKNGAIILPGSGINPQNALQIACQISSKELHLGSGIRHNGVLDMELFKLLFKNLIEVRV